MTTLRIDSLDDLRILTDALVASLPAAADLGVAELGDGAEPAEDLEPAEEMDPLIDEILRQAESAGSQGFDLLLEAADEDRLVAALDRQIEQFADAGDLFKVGDIQAILRQLGRG